MSDLAGIDTLKRVFLPDHLIASSIAVGIINKGRSTPAQRSCLVVFCGYGRLAVPLEPHLKRPSHTVDSADSALRRPKSYPATIT